MRKAVVLAAKVSISLGLMAWVARSLDGQALWRAASGIGWPLLILAVALTVLQCVLLGWRWHRIIGWLDARIPPGDAIRWVFIGVFFNQAMPSSVGGDAVRIWYLHRQRVPAGVPFASVAIERLTGLVLLGWMVSVATAWRWEVLGRHAFAVPMVVVGPALTVGLVALAVIGRRPPRWLSPTLAASLRATGQGLAGLLRSPWVFGEAVLLGMAGTFVAILAAMALGAGLGLPAGLADYTALVGGAVLLAVLPVSLGGWGVRESAMVALFGTIGVRPEPALALSLIWALLPLVVSLPAGLLWWRVRPVDEPAP